MVISHGGQTPLHGLSLWQTVKTAHRQLALSATSLTAKVPVNQLSISSLSASVQASTLPKSAPSPLTTLTHLPSLATTNSLPSKNLWVPPCASKTDSFLSVLKLISESPASVMASMETRKYFPQAVPKSMLLPL